MFLEGFLSILNPTCMILIMVGTIVGIVFGSLPGLTSTMAIALSLPLTFTMEPVQGLSLLMGLYIGGISGGLISAILLKIPGTPSSIATTFDGGPMAEKGEAGKALNVGVIYSFIGTIFSIAILITLAPKISIFTVKFGPYEYFAVAIFSLSMVGSLASGNIVKGLASALLGMSFALVGAAPITSALRLTFGNHQLDKGFDMLSVMIGLFAIVEIFEAAERRKKTKTGETSSYTLKGIGVSLKEFKEQFINMIRSALIGLGIGILPGIGGGTSNMIAYSVAQNSSKKPEKFGKGCIDGLIASETANNASIGGALIPLLTLGIPGDTATAMLIGAFMLHGISPGPMLFKTHGVLVYGIFAAMIIASIAMLIFMRLGMKGFVKILSIPRHILLPAIVVMCIVGAYGANNRMFDVWAVLLFGVIGYLLKKVGFSMSPFILGFILENIVETNLVRGVQYSSGSITPFITSPIAIIFFVLTVISILTVAYKEMKTNKTKLEVIKVI